MGALLDLHIGFGYVLSHDTQAEKLQAADEDDDTDGGSPAWDRIIEDQLSDDDGYQDQKGKNRSWSFRTRRRWSAVPERN